MEPRYRGWTNFQTWSAAVWIQQDVNYYWAALEVQNEPKPYDALSGALADAGYTATPDGIDWQDPRINVNELERLIRSL